MGCRIETVTFAFAVVEAVLWGIGAVGSFIGLICVLSSAQTLPDPFREQNDHFISPNPRDNITNNMVISEQHETSTLTAVLSVQFLIYVTQFIFNVLLCNGISKRNLTHIKLYFIQGLVKSVLAVVGIITLFVYTSVAALFIIPLGLYCGFLYMVNMTYKTFTGSEIWCHKRLVENA